MRVSTLRELTIRVRKQEGDAEIAKLFVIPGSPLGTLLPFFICFPLSEGGVTMKSPETEFFQL